LEIEIWTYKFGFGRKRREKIVVKWGELLLTLAAITEAKPKSK